MSATLKLLRTAPISARIGMGMVLIMLLAAIFAPVIALLDSTRVYRLSRAGAIAFLTVGVNLIVD
jgi:hypothetical protein